MAYRVVVDKPRRIRALTSSTRVVVADAKLVKSQVMVTRASYAAAVSSRVVNAFANYAKPVTRISYQNLSAIDMALDPFSLNKYFRLESFGVSDSASFDVAKTLNEALGASDLQDLSVEKGITSELSLGDFAYVLLEIQRAFSDSLYTSDTSVLGLGLNKTDSLGAYDVAHRDLGKGAADSFVFDEATAFSVSNVLSDNTSVSEQLDRTVSFVRGFAETASVSEVTAASVGKALQDSTSVSDLFARVVTYDRGFVESFGTTDTDSRSVGKSLADTAALSEALSRTVSYERAFSDTFALDDFTDVNAIRKSASAVKNNVFGFTDTQTFGTEKNLQDTTVVSELAALATDRPVAEAMGVSDVFQRVVSFSRATADIASVSDNSTAVFDKGLTDTAAVSELFQKDVAFNRTFADAVSFAEQSVAAFSKGLTDTASLTESIQITTTSLASSVLNAGALNSSPLNN